MVHLSDHFTFKNIFRITIFPIVMMVFTSLYSIVDGIFVANFAGNSSFAAVNLIYPFIMIIGSIGFMFGTGGTALVSKYLGEKKNEEAKSTFTLIVISAFILGVAISIAGFFLIKPIVDAMASVSSSATDEMKIEAIKYGRILCIAQFLFILQNVFQSFFMAAERSKLGFLFVVGGGVTNMILDALFIGVFKWGILGAAFATITGYAVASIGPILYFLINRKGILYFVKPKFHIKEILQSAYNGMSEFVSNIAMSVVSTIYNIVLLKAYGEYGVSAYGIIMYVSFVFMAIFIGYSIGIAPAVGYNYGAKNHDELRNILIRSLQLIMVTSIVMTTFCFLTARPFSRIFSNGDSDLLNLSIKAMRINSLIFLFCGFSIFSSCFFTALNNGTVSAIISFSRTIIFEIGFVYLLPLFMGNDGIWWSIVFGEFMCTVVASIFVLLNKKKYGY